MSKLVFGSFLANHLFASTTELFSDIFLQLLLDICLSFIFNLVIVIYLSPKLAVSYLLLFDPNLLKCFNVSNDSFSTEIIFSVVFFFFFFLVSYSIFFSLPFSFYSPMKTNCETNI